MLNHDASGYITMALTRGYRLKGLGFAIIPSGPLERMGFEFRIKEENPYFLPRLTVKERDRKDI